MVRLPRQAVVRKARTAVGAAHHLHPQEIVVDHLHPQALILPVRRDYPWSAYAWRRFLSGLLAAAAAAAPASAIVRFRGCGGVCGCPLLPQFDVIILLP